MTIERNIILAGVGGQGILTIAYLLDQAASELGLNFKQAEVHGMAQRGGAVQSHLRISPRPVHSDLVPVGGADLILSVEPLEALRYVHYLAPGGAVVSAENPFVNIPDYPADDVLWPHFEQLARCTLVDARALARRAGSVRAENTVMTGAAAAELGFPYELLERLLTAQFARKGDKVVQTNLDALRFGRAAGEIFRAARSAGLTLSASRLLTAALDPDGCDADHLAPWLTLLAGPKAAEIETVLRQRKAPVAPSRGAALASLAGQPGAALEHFEAALA